jgi:hypothetical protein
LIKARLTRFERRQADWGSTPEVLTFLADKISLVDLSLNNFIFAIRLMAASKK